MKASEKQDSAQGKPLREEWWELKPRIWMAVVVSVLLMYFAFVAVILGQKALGTLLWLCTLLFALLASAFLSYRTARFVPREILASHVLAWAYCAAISLFFAWVFWMDWVYPGSLGYVLSSLLSASNPYAQLLWGLGIALFIILWDDIVAYYLKYPAGKRISVAVGLLTFLSICIVPTSPSAWPIPLIASAIVACFFLGRRLSAWRREKC